MSRLIYYLGALCGCFIAMVKIGLIKLLTMLNNLTTRAAARQRAAARSSPQPAPSGPSSVVPPENPHPPIQRSSTTTVTATASTLITALKATLITPEAPILIAPSQSLTITPDIEPEITPPPKAHPATVWEARKWSKRKKRGVEIFSGTYTVINNATGKTIIVPGRIEVSSKGLDVYVKSPPKKLKKHPKSSCFQLHRNGWFWVHWSVPPKHPDDAILYIESVLSESINQRR